jgi:TonB family protein
MNVLELILKATILLLAAFAASAVLVRRPAALRHFVYTAVFAGVLALPAVSVFAPVMRVPVAAAPAAASITLATPAPPSVPARSVPWLPIAYTAGCFAVALRFTAGAIRTARLLRRAGTATVMHGVRVVESPEAEVPMTWGIWKPAVILPAGAAKWPATRLLSVILHERAHIQRRDLLAQTVAQAACCLYWFHPLAWAALRQLRRERELAADDAVLQQGVEAHVYASHLMETARNLASWIDAPAMADVSGLEARVAALLNPHRNRRPLSRPAATFVVMLTALAIAPLSTVIAQNIGSIAGTVSDPSGGLVPGCNLTVRNLDTNQQYTAAANAAGGFRFSPVSEGRYVIEARMPGFATFQVPVRVDAGREAHVDAKLQVGSVSEVITVHGSRSESTPPTPVAGRIRVGGNVTAARLVHQMKPAYSAEMKQFGLQGTVAIRAIIGKNGMLLNPVVVSSPDERLTSAALESVAGWAYAPALLNGMPVEVVTNIEVQYQLDK